VILRFGQNTLVARAGRVVRGSDPMESGEFVDACCITGGGAFRDFRRWRKHCRP